MSDLRPNSEIADGIHWIKGMSNSYIVETHDELILIDTGFNKKAKRIMEYIKTELEDRKVSSIFLTHHHTDHVNGAYHLHSIFHPNMFIHELDAPYVTNEKRRPLPNNIVLKPMFLILNPFMKGKAVHALQYVQDKETIGQIQAHFLPGHTPGSLGFLTGKVMFSGDTAVTNKHGDPSLPPKLFTHDMNMTIKSFKKLASMKFDMMLPGHGNPILHDASLRFQDAIQKIER